MESRLESRLGTAWNDEAEDTISLWEFVTALRSYRRSIGWILLGVTGLTIVTLLVLYLVLPVERVASIRFRVLFIGAAEGKYPNGVPFSSADIVSPAILTEVYRNNGLQRFGGYDAFKTSIFVLNSNPELAILGADYEARLADAKLTAVDRIRLEEEYRKKQAEVKDPVYSIALRRSDRLQRLPEVLAEKILTDVLTTWAEQADRIRGATRYNVSILSEKLLQPELVRRADYLIASDMLRTQAQRAISDLNELEKLPGSLLIRAGKDAMTLAETRARLQDVLRFDVEPLLGMIRDTGISKDPDELQIYLKTQTFRAKLDRDATQSHIRSVQAALREYTTLRAAQQPGDPAAATGSGTAAGRPAQPFDTPALIPQFGESFLDRLMQLSTETSTTDIAFRQRLTDDVIQSSRRMADIEREVALYEDLTRTVRATGTRRPPDLVARIEAKLSHTQNAIAAAVANANALYAEISKRNLSSATALYEVTQPFHTTSHRAVSALQLVLYFFLAIAVTVVVLPVGCLIHYAARRRRLPAPRPEAESTAETQVTQELVRSR